MYWMIVPAFELCVPRPPASIPSYSNNPLCLLRVHTAQAFPTHWTRRGLPHFPTTEGALSDYVPSGQQE